MLDCLRRPHTVARAHDERIHHCASSGTIAALSEPGGLDDTCRDVHLSRHPVSRPDDHGERAEKTERAHGPRPTRGVRRDGAAPSDGFAPSLSGWRAASTANPRVVSTAPSHSSAAQIRVFGGTLSGVLLCHTSFCSKTADGYINKEVGAREYADFLTNKSAEGWELFQDTTLSSRGSTKNRDCIFRRVL